MATYKVKVLGIKYVSAEVLVDVDWDEEVIDLIYDMQDANKIKWVEDGFEPHLEFEHIERIDRKNT